MKKYLLLLLLPVSICLRGQADIQIVVNKHQAKTNDDIPALILKECNCSHRKLSTDSVYNFVKSLSFYPHNKTIVFNTEPISFEEITTNHSLSIGDIAVGYMSLYSSLRDYIHIVLSDEKMSISQQEGFEHLDLQAIIELYSAIWDKKTDYTRSITQWDKNRLPPNWFTIGQYNRVRELTNKQMPKMAWAVQAEFDFIQISRPVFDVKYMYALVVVRQKNNQLVPLLYKRGADGWQWIVRKQ